LAATEIVSTWPITTRSACVRLTVGVGGGAAAARFGPRVDADHFLAKPDAGDRLSASIFRIPEFLKNLATSMWSGGS
jgi:hypothetical protein